MFNPNDHSSAIYGNMLAQMNNPMGAYYDQASYWAVRNVNSGAQMAIAQDRLRNALVSPVQMLRNDAHKYASEVRARNPSMQVKRRIPI